MAILINKELEHLGKPLVFNDVYVKIKEVRVQKPYSATEGLPIHPASSAIVLYYSDDTCKTQIEVKHFSFDLDFSENAENVWKQIYLYLKKLPEFIESVDC